ncbi:MAG: universal stress protein [Cyclobacteriaceae bacterium]
MKSRFIILIDFSRYTKNLIRYAYDWSKQANAELLLVHHTTVLTPALTDQATREQITGNTNNEALTRLKALVKELIPPSVEVSYFVSERPLQFTLNQLISGARKNLIFAGLKGTGLLKKLFLGSTVVHIIEEVNNIIVAVPKEISSFSQEKIFIGVTEKHPINTSELDRFLEFIGKKKTCLTFFYLALPNEETQEIEKQLKDLSYLYADRFDTKIKIYEQDNPFKNIKKVINKKEDELLIVQKGSRFLSDQFFRRFLINDLVYLGQTPLIVLP